MGPNNILLQNSPTPNPRYHKSYSINPHPTIFIIQFNKSFPYNVNRLTNSILIQNVVHKKPHSGSISVKCNQTRVSKCCKHCTHRLCKIFRILGKNFHTEREILIISWVKLPEQDYPQSNQSKITQGQIYHVTKRLREEEPSILLCC